MSKSAAAIKASSKTAKKRNMVLPIKKRKKFLIIEQLEEVSNVGKTETTPEEAADGGMRIRYHYRDFSNVSENSEPESETEIPHEVLMRALAEPTAIAAAQALQHQQPMSFLSPPPPVQTAAGWVRCQRFPVKLYALLNQPNLSQVITWLPHGRSWKVLKRSVFETAVLPVFFMSDNYHSFNRVVNAWSFRRKSTGPDRGSYFHEFFLRGKPHLQKHMRRLPRTHKKVKMSKSDEPDLYELNRRNPLPSLEEAAVEEEQKLERRRAAKTDEK